MNLMTSIHLSLPKAAAGLLAVAMLCAAPSAQADPITPRKAKELAGQYINVGATQVSPMRVKANSNADQAYYIFQGNDGRGYAIVSADDAMGDVIAYSRDSRIDTSAAVMGDFLRNFTQAYHSYRNGDASAAHPARVMHFKKKIGPLLKTEWDQTTPYNNLLPNHYRYTGCGPTAMAQVMNYHKWPKHGKGSVSYVNGIDSLQLSGDFSQSVYDWANMPEPICQHVAPEAQKQAVGTLMRDCGLASKTFYANTWSGAFEYDINYAMNNNFDYTAVHYYRANEGSQHFFDMVVSEIAAGFPVIMTGGEGQEGHVFVADGVDERGYVHFNFGWGGQSDGFFQFPYSVFRKNCNAIFAHPNDSVSAPMPAAFLFTSPRIQFNGTGILQVKGAAADATIARTDSITFRVAEFLNSSKPFSGDLAIALYDEQGNGIDTIPSIYHDQGGFTSLLFNDTLGNSGLIVESNEVLVKANIKDLRPGYYKAKALFAAHNNDTNTYGDWFVATMCPQLEIELTDDSLRISEQGGFGRKWQLCGEPVWSQETLMPGDKVSVTLPIDNLKGLENDGALQISLVDPANGTSYYVGSNWITIDKYYSDSVTVEGSISQRCQQGVYDLLLTVTNGNEVDTIKNVHNVAEPIKVTIGEKIVTGISSANAKQNTGTKPAYNISGQQVGEAYRGVVIRNGKKVVRK